MITEIKCGALALLITIMLYVSLACSGCGAEFSGGVATGAALSEIAHKAETDLIGTINAMNAETARYNEAIGTIKGLKGREKDPVIWLALASVIGNAVSIGRASKKK
jgi:hypothetical protein